MRPSKFTFVQMLAMTSAGTDGGVGAGKTIREAARLEAGVVGNFGAGANGVGLDFGRRSAEDKRAGELSRGGAEDTRSLTGGRAVPADGIRSAGAGRTGTHENE